jgi:RNA polymerase sigma-70 factor (ECF subfamily)
MMSDEAGLISQAAQGDAAAQEALYEAYFARAYRLAYLLLQNTGDAEEVVQDTFVYLFAHLERYDVRRGSFWAWLRVTLVSRCRNRFRRKEPDARSLDVVEAQGELRSSGGGDRDPAVVVARRDSRREIRDALDQVSPGARDALVLRYYEELTYSEISEILGCSVEAARARVVHGKVQLRRILSDRAEAPVRAKPVGRTARARER